MKLDFAKLEFPISIFLALVGIGFTLSGGLPLFAAARASFGLAGVVLIWGVVRMPRHKLPAIIIAGIIVVMTIVGVAWSFAWVSANEKKESETASVPRTPAPQVVPTAAPVPVSSPAPVVKRRRSTVPVAHKNPPTVMNCGQFGGVNNGIYEANCNYR